MKDQLHRIKSLMGLVKEQKKDNLQQQTQLPSDYLGKGGSFERQLYDGTSENYYKRYLNGIPPTRIKKVRLVFPLENWELLVYLAKFFQIVTGVFRNLGEALKFVDYLSEKNVVTDELVVGSHGKTIKANKRSVLVRKVRTNGTVTSARAWCSLHGNKLRGRVADRLCDVTVRRTSASMGRVRITAAPVCTKALRVHAVITAKKAGRKRAVWRKTWRVQAASPITCRINGTG